MKIILKTSLIIHQSKTGTTKKYGFAIRDYLNGLDLEAKAVPVQNYVEDDFNEADFVFLGCWTSRLFFILQHPDKTWSNFAAKSPAFNGKKAALSTTHKLLTYSILNKTKQFFKGKTQAISLTLKARGIVLSENDKKNLKDFVLD